MDSNQISSLIYFVLMITFISLVNCNPQFIDYFTRPGGKFSSAFSLSTLKDADRQIICNTLGRESNNYTTNNEILLVTVLIKGSHPIYSVPAFQCASIQTSFYVTYVVPDLFFKMALVRPSVTGGFHSINTIITPPRQIRAYSDSQSAIFEKILAYFNSHEYIMEAENVLRPYYVNNTWKNLCARYDLQFESYYEYSMINFRVPTRSLRLSSQTITTSQIPVVDCHTLDPVHFYIIHYVNGILVTANKYLQLEFDNMIPRRYYDHNDVLLTYTPLLNQLLPSDMADDIIDRVRDK